MASSTYVTRGGVEGRERLRLLAAVLHATTAALFDRLGIGPGLSCLDAGCGGGDVTLHLARLAGPSGAAVGVDLDETKLRLAADEAAAQGIANVSFRRVDLLQIDELDAYDLVYCRFLLSHLVDPLALVRRFLLALRPGGRLIVEDIDLRGAFAHPPSAAFDRYLELYAAAVRRRGADPDIGPRLPGLLREAGFGEVALNVVQPAGFDAPVKLAHRLTIENVAPALVAEELATREEIDAVLDGLDALANDPDVLASFPRIVQAWGTRPAAS